MAKAQIRDVLELQPEPPRPSPKRHGSPNAPSMRGLQALAAVDPPKMRVVEKGWTFKESQRTVAEVLDLARDEAG
jgi:hypothetical protein